MAVSADRGSLSALTFKNKHEGASVASSLWVLVSNKSETDSKTNRAAVGDIIGAPVAKMAASLMVMGCVWVVVVVGGGGVLSDSVFTANVLQRRVSYITAPCVCLPAPQQMKHLLK